MSKYKDANGVPIKEGDVVLYLVSLNQNSSPVAFITTICKKKGRCLVLASAHSDGQLRDAVPSEMKKVTPTTDLQEEEEYFRCLQEKRYGGEECQ